MAKLRIVFMGTGDIALPSLRSLLNDMEQAYELVALVTQPDKPVGRRQVMTAPAIKELALSHDVAVMQPESAREKNFLEALKARYPIKTNNATTVSMM